MNDQERERRALEALIVLRMRTECIDAERVLSDEEKATLECLSPGFIDKVLANADAAEQPDDPVRRRPQRTDLMAMGMNRADDPEASKSDIESNREDVLKKMEEDDNGGRDRAGG